MPYRVPDLRYQNRRPDYIDAWFHTIDWEVVAERHAEAPATLTRLGRSVNA